MDWVSILTYITGTVDQELLLRNEYLVVENRILKPSSRPGCDSQMQSGLHLQKSRIASAVRPSMMWPMLSERLFSTPIE